jgi:D-3-phosphoglycerate dehydrogenase
MAPKVLISDKLSEAAVQILRDRGIEVDFRPELGKDKDALAAVIGDYDGLAIRSATKATEKLIANADNLKVIGRAGIGVDNVDIAAASKKGIIVMNTPFGNSITTAEHAISMMMAVARQIPEANASTHAGKWEKSRFMGVELTGKTLGVIGAGNIGSIVIDRAQGLRMKVVAYDPYLSQERADKIGVEKVELDELLARADFITLHVPLTDATRNILSAENIAKTKKGVRIVNCARGGLVDEEALAEALKSGHVAGAGFDVFSVEPATENPLFNLPNVVCTPHLGAATTEAQENVALQVAEQMSDYLLTGAVQNALNMPSVTAEEAKVMGPWIKLADHLGNFIGQMTDEPIKAINILYDGIVSDMNLEALNCGAIAGIMKKANPDVNMVSAPVIAKERGIKVSTTRQDQSGAFEGYMKVTVVTSKRERSIAGTVFSDGKPRFIQIKGINIDAEVGSHMLYTTNEDVPGIIGTLGTTMGSNGVNIANFTLGRAAAKGEAIALLYVDEPVPASAIKALNDTGLFNQIKPLTFDVA